MTKQVGGARREHDGDEDQGVVGDQRPGGERERSCQQCRHRPPDPATLLQATVQAAWIAVRRLDLRTVRPSPLVRTLVQATVVLVVLVGIAFGVQAALLNVPSNAQLVAVDALKALARYHVMDSTEQLSARPRRSLCFENRVLDRKTDSFVLGSFVLVGKRH